MEILDNQFALYPTRGLKCAGCNFGENYYSDGYRYFRSGLYFHKECTKSSLKIRNLYHPQHPMQIDVYSENADVVGECKICKGNLPKMFYTCQICSFSIDLTCAKKEVVVKIEGPKIHELPLTLIPKMILFTCHLCGLLDDRFSYACNICDVRFHKDCAESTPELNYSCHPRHPLKCLTRVPSYIDDNCCLCRNKFNIVFYHCSICNFSIDVDCAKNPPPFTLVDPKAHEHQLILMPQQNFVCNACGMDDDPNPYVCSQCNFTIHRNCIDIPRVIKINRHEHNIHYSHCLEPGNWRCGVCHKKIRWNCGVYSCSKCKDYGIHLRCATKFGIWDGIDLEGISENTVEVKSYKVIGEGLIEHLLHKHHALKLEETKNDGSGEDMWCKACTYPVFSNPFYSCMICDDFVLHKNCAYLPKKKNDSLYKVTMHLLSNVDDIDTEVAICMACQSFFEGFCYGSENGIILDVQCGSISEPFFHESHQVHSLYINYSMKDMSCNACGDKTTMGLSCDDCEFVLHIKCSNMPKMVKHKYDTNHLLSLCYGEITSMQYVCEICEEELNPMKWFYSCDHCGTTFHVRCTLGDFTGLKPAREDSTSDIYVISNNHLSRPICEICKSTSHFPSLLKISGITVCSRQCLRRALQDE